MIDSSLQPAWIIQREKRKADAAAHAEKSELEHKIAELLMEKHSVPFCLDFLRGLQVNLGCFSDISASMKPSSTPDEGVQFYTVIIHSSVLHWGSITATIQFLKPRTDGIQILVWGKDAKYIRLSPLPTGDGIGAIVPDRAMPVNATRLAEFVAEEWVNHICPE